VLPDEALLFTSIYYWSIKEIYQKSKRLQTHLLMVFSSIRNMVSYVFNHQQSTCGVTGVMFVPVSSQSILTFTFNMLLVMHWKNILHKSKRPHTCLLLIFNIITNMADYILLNQ